MYNTKKSIAYYHLPGLFEFYELYRVFLPLFRMHREYFYDWCEIGSIYGAPSDCIWGGGRTSFGTADPRDVLALMREYDISSRLTFSNSLLKKEHLSDKKCNDLCSMFEEKNGIQNGVIIHSDLLLDYLKNKYGEKVYKLPINLPITCPNRLNGKRGCSFCAECGTGFESLDAVYTVTEQLAKNQEHIAKKYKAKKYIAYFQNYTNTFLPLNDFRKYMEEAAQFPDIIELAVSTRPDCIKEEYLDALRSVSEQYHCNITIELGLQTANYHTLLKIDRGHTLAEYIDAAIQIKRYGFDLCTHVILNLPGDTITDSIETAKILSALSNDCVKVHSLYIAKNTRLCEEYENGTITLCSKEEYFRRVTVFLEYLKPRIAVERLFSRIPEKDAVFCNWQTSWWKLKDELEAHMIAGEHYQGRLSGYLDGAALNEK